MLPNGRHNVAALLAGKSEPDQPEFGFVRSGTDILVDAALTFALLMQAADL
jgi:hypothetical protein